MLGALAKIAGKVANVGANLLKGLLNVGEKIPKGHQANEPIDYAALDSSTKVLGLIYMTLQRAREAELADRIQNEKDHKDKLDDENKRNEELIKALTVRRKPKKKKKEEPKEEPKKEEKKKPPPKKEEEVKKEAPPKVEKVTKKEAPPKPAVKKAEEVKPEAPKAPEKVPPKEAAKPPAEKVPSKALPKIPPSQAETSLVGAAKNAGITEPAELAQFLAQTSHESGGFQYVRELGKDSYFAKYEGRKDLGNTQPGDGLKYKGRGFIQLTGRANYEHFGKAINEDLINNPELAEKPDIAAKLAVAFWKERVKPKVKDFNNTEAVTKIINGGYNGLEDRKNRFQQYTAKVSNGEVGVPSNQALPSTLAPSTGAKIDQASKENKTMKDAAANAKKQQTVNNVGINQTNQQSSSSSDNSEFDDRNPQQKKKG
jgi:putative chitinase